MRQLGNAVPVTLAQTVGASVKQALIETGKAADSVRYVNAIEVYS
jgi:hypothetical protein